MICAAGATRQGGGGAAISRPATGPLRCQRVLLWVVALQTHFIVDSLLLGNRGTTAAGRPEMQPNPADADLVQCRHLRLYWP